MANFVVEANIERYASRLRTDSDPHVRANLKTLLIEEENLFGFRIEQLHKVDSHIANCKHRIARQTALIEQMPLDWRDRTAALRLLTNLAELLDLFEDYRKQIMIALGRRTADPSHVRLWGNGAGAANLTPREIEVLTLMAQGNTSDQVAKLLDITRRTVDAHVYAILPKLDAQNRTHAVAIALESGIIKLN